MKIMSQYSKKSSIITNRTICNDYNTIKLFMTKTFRKIHIYIY